MIRPIIFIDDDEDDRLLYAEAIRQMELTCMVRIFASGATFLKYLEETTDRPHIIISDLNMPGLSGYELKAKIEKLDIVWARNIPFVLLSTNANKFAVDEAALYGITHIFQKPDLFEEITSTLQKILSLIAM